MHISARQANLYLPKENGDAFSDTTNIRTICSRVQDIDCHNIIIDTFLIRYFVICSNFSVRKSKVMHKTHRVTIYQTTPMWPLGFSEKPVQAHQVATVCLELTGEPRQVNDFSRKAYLHVKNLRPGSHGFVVITQRLPKMFFPVWALSKYQLCSFCFSHAKTCDTEEEFDITPASEGSVPAAGKQICRQGQHWTLCPALC